MKNSQNTTPATILLSNGTGIGKTDSLPAVYGWTNNNTFNAVGYESVTIDDNLLKALFITNLNKEFKNSNNLQAVLNAYSEDYLGTFHASASGKESKKKNPLINPGKVLTSQEYRRNYIKAHLTSASSSNVIIGVIEAKEALTSASTKGDMMKIINSVIDLVETEENRENFDIIAENEAQDAKKFEELTSSGFLAITRLAPVKGVSHFSASIPAASVGSMQVALLAGNYTLVSSDFNTATLNIDIVFSAV